MNVCFFFLSFLYRLENFVYTGFGIRGVRIYSYSAATLDEREIPLILTYIASIEPLHSAEFVDELGHGKAFASRDRQPDAALQKAQQILELVYKKSSLALQM